MKIVLVALFVLGSAIACSSAPEPTVTQGVLTPTPVDVLATAGPAPTPTLAPTSTPTLVPLIPTPTMTEAEYLRSLHPDYRRGITPTLTPDPTSIPPPTPTPTPVPTSTPPPLPGELTQGVRALVRCAGESEEYWLEHGPPGMTADLVVCLNEYLEAN